MYSAEADPVGGITAGVVPTPDGGGFGVGVFPTDPLTGSVTDGGSSGSTDGSACDVAGLVTGCGSAIGSSISGSVCGIGHGT